MINCRTSMVRPILILHLSDLHFGDNSRFAGLDPSQLGQRFSQAITHECGQHYSGKQVDLVIVTGDVAETARKDEYQKAKAFFEKLANDLNLDRRRFIFTPGNHDVYWIACKRAQLDQEENSLNGDELRQLIDQNKFQNYYNFLNDFYDIARKDLGYIELNCGGFIYNIDEFKCSIAALNSSEVESHREEDHRGFLSETQSQSLMDQWHKDEFNDYQLKIIAVHHNPVATVPENVNEWKEYLIRQNSMNKEVLDRFVADCVGLEGHENLRRVAEDCHVPLVLHGHHHSVAQDAWTWRRGDEGLTHVLSAGSLGLAPNKLPKDQPNNIQLVLLDTPNRKLHAWTLVYDPRARAEGIVTPGNFITDSASPKGYHQQLCFPKNPQPSDLSDTFSGSEQKSNIIDSNEATCRNVEAFIAHPYPLQKNFAGRIKERQMLTKWLIEGQEPIFSLVAIGGMGKSALTWVWFNFDVRGENILGLLPDEPIEAENCKLPESNRPCGFFWWSFYEREANFIKFLDEAIKYVSHGSVNLNEITSNYEKVRKLVDLLQRKYVLLVLDGFERELCAYASINAAYQGDVVEKDEKGNFRTCTERYAADFLRQIAALPAKSRILLTSRLLPRELDGLAGCHEDELNSLDPNDAVRFFQAHGIRGRRTEIQEACDTYGYHPLALRLLVGMILKDPVRPKDVTVAAGYNPIDQLVPREHHILAMSYDALQPKLRELLSRLAAFRSSMDYEAVKLLSPFEDEYTLKNALNELLERGLLLFDPEGKKYDLHRIVRSYAYEHLTDKEEVHTRLREYFAAIPQPISIQDLDDLVPLIELYFHTIGARKYDEAREILYNKIIEPLYYRFGALQISIKLLRALFPDGEDLPPRLGSPHHQSEALNSLAVCYSNSGQPRQAAQLLETSKLLEENNSGERNLAIVLGNLATSQLGLGELEQAFYNYGRKIKLSQKIDDKVIEAGGHLAMSSMMAILGDSKKSSQEIDMVDMPHKIPHNPDNNLLKYLRPIYGTRALNILLLRQQNVRQLNAALRAARKSYKYANILQNETAMIDLEWLIGTILIYLAYRDNNQKYLHEAETHLMEALTRCRKINLVDQEPDILLSWARWHHVKRNNVQALQDSEEALYIADRCELRLKQADIHNFMAQLTLDSGDADSAKRHAKIAYECAWCDGPPYCYKPALDEAEEMLRKLGAEQPTVYPSDCE